MRIRILPADARATAWKACHRLRMLDQSDGSVSGAVQAVDDIAKISNWRVGIVADRRDAAEAESLPHCCPAMV